MALVDLSTLTGENLVKRLLQIDQANYSALDGLHDYQGNDVTDLIVDAGSNSDGNWIRFADGTMICYSPEKEWDHAEVWTFPISFTSTTNMYAGASVIDPGTNQEVAGVNIDTVNQADIRIRDTSGNTINAKLARLFAIGRWK